MDNINFPTSYINVRNCTSEFLEKIIKNAIGDSNGDSNGDSFLSCFIPFKVKNNIKKWYY